MSINGFQSLFSLLLILMTGVTVQIANAGISETRRNHCGSDLADALKLLCKGKYQSRENLPSGDAEATGDGSQQVSTITQECCRSDGGCPIQVLGKYCAKTPDIATIFSAISRMSSSDSSQTSRSSVQAPPSLFMNPSKSESSDTNARPGGGRLVDIMKNYNPVDLSFLLDTRLDGYEAVPSRQRRRR